MKLLKLEVSGYRSLKDIVWEPGDLNVLIGPNASGKTNLIKALELLAASADGRLRNFVEKEGGMVPMLWDGQGEYITFSVEVTPPIHAFDELLAGVGVDFDKEESPSDVQAGSIKYEVALRRLMPGGWYFIEREHLTSPTRREELLRRSVEAGRAELLDEVSGAFLDVRQEAKNDETLISLGRHLVPGTHTARSFRENLLRWKCFRDFRTHGDAPVRKPPVARHENDLDGDGSNLVTFLHTWYSDDAPFRETVDLAMRAAFGDDFERLEFPPFAEQRVRLAVRWKSLSRPVQLADISDGTLRFLFLLCALAPPNAPPLIAIEEPEVGLHPSMLPIIAELAHDASTRSQVILTTHSTDFLNAFRKMTLRTTVFGLEDGATTLRVLDGDDLQYWLDEYSLGDFMLHGGAGAAE